MVFLSPRNLLHVCASPQVNPFINLSSRATESRYPWYPGDDADQKFKDAEIKSSLLAFWKTLNFANPTTNKKVTSKIGNVCNFLNSWRIRKIQSLPESLRGALNHGVF